MTRLDHKQDDAMVLVVGDVAAAEQLSRTQSHPVVQVDNYLDALGEMSNRELHALVGQVGPMRTSLEATVRAVRQVAPSSRLVLVAQASDEPDAMRAVRLGFDDYLIGPFGPGELAAAIDHRDATPHEADKKVELEVDADVSLPRITERARPAVSNDSDDLALVEKLLTRRAEMRDQAVRVIQRELKTSDVRWSAENVLDVRTCVPITYEQQQLGYLSSDECGLEELAEWGDWLARWLALEARITQLNHMALHDELTGVWNRRYFDKFLDSVVRRAKEQRFRVTVLIFDIDDFKQYNDQYGHAAGDAILRAAAKLMDSVVRKHDVVARIGGDEFGVIFWDGDKSRQDKDGGTQEHPQSIPRIAARFQKAICSHKFPQLADLAPGTLTISGGLASYPWDGQTPDELVKLADKMLLKSKAQGKNAITFGPGAMKVCQVMEDDRGKQS